MKTTPERSGLSFPQIAAYLARRLAVGGVRAMEESAQRFEQNLGLSAKKLMDAAQAGRLS